MSEQPEKKEAGPPPTQRPPKPSTTTLILKRASPRSKRPKKSNRRSSANTRNSPMTRKRPPVCLYVPSLPGSFSRPLILIQHADNLSDLLIEAKVDMNTVSKNRFPRFSAVYHPALCEAPRCARCYTLYAATRARRGEKRKFPASCLPSIVASRIRCSGSASGTCDMSRRSLFRTALRSTMPSPCPRTVKTCHIAVLAFLPAQVRAIAPCAPPSARRSNCPDLEKNHQKGS
jgi:hypothetical protein